MLSEKAVKANKFAVKSINKLDMMINKKIVLVLFAALLMNLSTKAQVLVEAESFTDYGGWVSDHQAFEKIGSAYLMAHGMGRKVENASTSVRFANPGKYYVYVSTYNWTSPWYDKQGPGAFKVSVNGKHLPQKLGVTGTAWNWEYAGEVTIKQKAVIKLHDLTGFNGRVDAIYFSKVKQAPISDYKAFALQRSKLSGYSTPQHFKDADLVVVGGGVAGCATALAAARYGLKVFIIDNLPWLGGNNALGVKACGLMCENLFPQLGNITCQVIGMNIQDKNKRESHFVRDNGTGYMDSHIDNINTPLQDNLGSDLLISIDRLTDEERHSVGKSEKNQNMNEYRRRNVSIIREQLLKQAGASIFQNIQVYASKVENGKITTIYGRSLKNGEEFVFDGTLFVDCTGDGTLGYISGADYTIGRESKSYANEPSAPEIEDNKKMGASMHWYAYPRKNAGSFPNVNEIPWAIQCSDDFHIDASQWQWWWETGLEQDNAMESELVRDNFLRAVFGNWAYLKNNIAKYHGYRLDYLQHIGMKRESRRLLGDVILNENDLKQRIEYPDASFTTTWTMDLHYARPDNSSFFAPWEWITYCTNEREIWIEPYHVPYRCLYSRNINNLFIGGRCMSVTHQALGTVRVQATLGMAGEVIAMAAKICKDNNSLPRDVYQQYLTQLIEYMTQGAPLN